MFRASFFLCFYSCLRFREAVHSTSAAHTLTVSRVTKQNSGFTITLQSYKHSRASRDPIPKLVLETVQGPHCPVAALNKYLVCRPAREGPLFLNEQGSPVNRNSLVNVLRHCLSLCGLPVTRYNTHSFRIGRATQLAIEGYSDDYIPSSRALENQCLPGIHKDSTTNPAKVNCNKTDVGTPINPQPP